MKTKWIMMLLVSAAVLTGITSCKNDKGSAHLQMRLMDAPSPYAFDAIYLDVVGVEVNVNHDNADEWITMHSTAGVYNLLTLVNGADVLLVNEDIPEGRIEQVRLILGTGNTIVVDGRSHPLTIPSGQESGLKINVHQDVDANTPFTLMLDFDAAHSIVVTGNGDYHLQPVINGFVEQQTGSIHGTVVIPQTGVAIIVSDVSKHYSTYADAGNGGYVVRGITPGTYTVAVYLPDSDVPTLYEGIVVTAGTTTEIRQ